MRHSITGVNKEFRDKVVTALNDLELTKNVAELQCVMDQVTKVSVELQQHAGDQEAKVALMAQRVEANEKTMEKIEKELKGVGQRLGDRLVGLDDERGKWEKRHKDAEDELFKKLATQETVLTERIEEIKALFKKCDDVFEHSGTPTVDHAPAATSAAGALPL